MATDQVHFVVGREDFYIEKRTLLNGISKYFSVMFSGNFKESHDNESIYIDADPMYFRRVLNTIRYGKSSEYIPAEVAEYFGITNYNDTIAYDLDKIDKTDEIQIQIHKEITQLISDMDPAYKRVDQPNIIGHQHIRNNLIISNSRVFRSFREYYNKSMIFGREQSNIKLDKIHTTNGNDVYSHITQLWHDIYSDIFIKVIINDRTLTPINIMQAIRLIRIIKTETRSILSEFTPSSLMVEWNNLPKMYRNFAEVCIQNHGLFPILIPHQIMNQNSLNMYTKIYIVVDPAIITDVQIIYNTYEGDIINNDNDENGNESENIITQTYRSETTICDAHDALLLSTKLNMNLIILGFYVFVTTENNTTISANNITLSYNNSTSTHDCLRLIAIDLYTENTPDLNIYRIKDSTIINLSRIANPVVEIMFAQTLNGRYTIHIVYDSINVLSHSQYIYLNDSRFVKSYADLV